MAAVPLGVAAAVALVMMRQRDDLGPALAPVTSDRTAGVAPGVPGSPATPAPGLTPKVVIAVKSEPSGASVLQDGVRVGTTPLTLSWNRSSAHQLTFQLAGHQDLKRLFRLEKDDAIEVRLRPVE